MDRYKELKIFTRFWFTAFPTTGNLFFLAALSDFAKWRTTAIPASIFAPELHHGTEKIVTMLVVHKGFLRKGFLQWHLQISHILPDEVPCEDPVQGQRFFPCARGSQGSKGRSMQRHRDFFLPYHWSILMLL